MIVSTEATLTSSVIDSVVYDNDSSVMTIKFHTGSVWQYKNVEQRVFEEIINAESSGAAFNKLVRNTGNYPSTKT